MNGQPTQLTKRGAPAIRAALVRWAVLGATGVLLGILGPFGTFEAFSLAGRLAYWVGLIACGTAVFEIVMIVGFQVAAALGASWHAPVGAAILITGTVQTAVTAVVAAQFHERFYPGAVTIAELYGYVLLITLLVSILPVSLELRRRGLIGVPPTTEATRPEAEPLPGPAVETEAGADGPGNGPLPFHRRMPPQLTGELLALEMEDHYLRVHTDGGSALILMRLRDAVAELAGSDGLQVHRSWWVSAGAIERVSRDPSGRLTLILRNRLTVPVSRARIADVRRAGWLTE